MQRANIQRLLILCLTVCVSFGAKIAIVPAPGASLEAADLLTVEFSKISGIEMVERAQLDKILIERSLATTRRADVLKAANFLGADGVLFLDSVPAGTNRVIGARLVTTRQGAVLHANRAPWSSAWTPTMLREFGPLLSKTITPPNRVVKISVLNLRSPSATPQAEAMDRELTSLLLLRLAREPDVFVLERRKLPDLVFEKDLALATEQFWTGAILLDGTVNRLGVEKNTVTVTARLQSHGAAARELEVTGSRTNLPSVINELVGKILTSLQMTARATWDPLREAGQHLDEANWALRWEMYEEAQAAADSAWSLGLHSPEAAAARTLAYLRPANHKTNYFSYNYVEEVFTGVSSVQRPDAAKLEPLNMSLAFAGDVAGENPAWFTNTVWNSAVVESLHSVGHVLECFYFCPGAGDKNKLAEIRSRSRSLLDPTLNHPANARWFWFGSTNAPDLKALESFFAHDNIFSAAAIYGSIFNDSADETLALYRKLFTGDAYPFVREYLAGRPPTHPEIADWKGKSRSQKGPWLGFIDELKKSTNQMYQLEGQFYALDLITNVGALRSGCARFFATALTNATAMRMYGVPPHFEKAVHNFSQDTKFGYNHGQGPTATDVTNDYWREFRDLNGSYEGHIAALAYAGVEVLYKEHIKALKPYDSKLFADYFAGLSSNAKRVEAREELGAYLAATTNNAPLDQNSAAALEALLQRLDAALNMLSPAERMATMRKRFEEARNRRATNPPPARPVLLPDTNTFVLQITPREYWELAPPPELAPRYELMQEPIYRDGKLWFLTTILEWEINEERNSRTPKPRPLIVSVDPVTFRAERFLAPKFQELSEIQLSILQFGPRPKLFEKHGPFLYLLDGVKLRRMDLRNGQWRDFSTPASDGALYVVADRLFLSASSGIFEILNDGETSRVLASVRRRPAQTSLDEMDALGKPVLFPGSNGALRASIKEAVYAFAGTNWTKEFDFHGSRFLLSDDNAIFASRGELRRLGRTNSSPIFLATAPVRNGLDVTPGPRRGEALFDLPEQFIGGDRLYFSLDGRVTLFEERIHSQNDVLPASHLMVAFDPGEPRPIVIPVQFDASYPKRFQSKGSFALFTHQLWFLPTNQGLFIGPMGDVGFWKISKENLVRGFREAKG